MKPDPAVLDRVRKLLALATSSNVHEAAAAVSRAHTLIAQHRLQGWLDAEQAADDDPDPIVAATDEPLAVGRRIRRWRVVLAGVLADANGCVVYTRPVGPEDHLVLVGRSRDRAAVHTLFEWLDTRLAWLSATHGAGRSKKWHEAFRIGAVDAIAERLKSTDDAMRSALETTALARMDPAEAAHRAALERFVAERLKLGKGRTLRVDNRAWLAGRAASLEIGLPDDG